MSEAYNFRPGDRVRVIDSAIWRDYFEPIGKPLEHGREAVVEILTIAAGECGIWLKEIGGWYDGRRFEPVATELQAEQGRKISELERQLAQRDADLKHCEELCNEACRILCQFRPAQSQQIITRIRRVANGHCPPVPTETAATTAETISAEKFTEYVARCNSGDVKPLKPIRPPYRPFQKQQEKSVDGPTHRHSDARREG